MAVAPYLKILTSIPFWAVCAAQFGNLWGLNLILTYTPKYLSETIGFNLKESAGLASLPYLARMTASGMFGILGDWMLKKEIMSVTRLRKFFIIFSHFIPAACLFMIRVAGCNQVGVVALLILCQFFNGAVVVSHFINPQDLAPNFAGSVFGVMNFIGMTTGIFVPKITGAITTHYAVAPYLKILTSIPFWAVCAAQFGNLWGLNLILTYTPKYLSETIGFNLKESAGLASLPYLARMTASGMFGILGDWMLKKEIMSVTRLRKFFIIFSHFIPAACLFMIRVAGCNQVGVVALLILCQFFNGAVVVSHFINPQDLAPNFAGSVFGVMNFIGMTTGIFVPKITGAITTHYNKNLAGATIIYTIGGSVYFCGGLLFIIFGTAKTQPWNEIKETEPEPNQGNK
ncbi:hypothetical protein Zmor_024731 [Zophobas morio]|uniref:Major facilitator superfamily (MFS) profile domain-containing protein n=1 Tax=Zophobas morio TaxID=2755281 RepID=A0AA38I2Z8_9CUCU|nr:hypothetical protein Zmor_024731 [Zophobas morio]